MSDLLRNDSKLKILSLTAFLVIAIVIGYAVFEGTFGNRAYDMNGNAMNNAGMMTNNNGNHAINSANNGMFNNNYNGLNTTNILVTLLDILLIVSVIGLVLGIGMHFYRNFSSMLIKGANSEGVNRSTICANCHSSISSPEFRYCPVCGASTRGV